MGLDEYTRSTRWFDLANARCVDPRALEGREMKGRLVTALVSVALLFTVYNARALDTVKTRLTLTGVAAVEVVVEELSPSLQADGLSKDALKTDVELRLRAAGIRVATTSEALKMPGHPYLYVRVTAMSTTNPSGGCRGFAFAIELEFKQATFLERNRSIWTMAPTWSVGGLAVGLTADDVRPYVRNCADQFSNAYFAVNPKK